MKKKFIILAIFIVLVISIYLIIPKKTEKEVITLDFKDRKQEIIDVNVMSIYKYGWLQVQGTTIDVPILTIADTDDEISHGWVATNSIGTKTRRVLVGHNVLNVSSNPMVNDKILTDFEDLMAFSYYDFAKENMYVSFLEEGVSKLYVIYAIGFYDYDYDNAAGINDKKEVKEYIKNTKSNSIYNYDVDVNENDNILTIKTCTRYFGSDEKQQFVIDLREVRKDEKTYKYNVKKTKLYNEYKLKDHYNANNID